MLFFVLSGFLITSLLVNERFRYGHIDLRAFYLRRVLRLAPALACFVFAVMILIRLGLIVDVPPLRARSVRILFSKCRGPQHFARSSMERLA
jgi:peptidoglycan/LPS O-acetylase OafA/YrhL